MMYSFVILFIAFVFIMFLASIHWESVILSATNVVFCFIGAVLAYSIEIPYIAITSSDTILTGVHGTSDPGLATLLGLFAIPNVILVFLFQFGGDSGVSRADEEEAGAYGRSIK